ncbi:PREDICTED: phosphoglycerate mutase-like protein 2 [Camelina sativa]|uniref:Phosphoglycerate mutase-like protein 2 n=1 Tax=Camelina sativa TaxID=90675 RepID=A0ABM0Z6H2_CAMSA|nr:PREDICTED: phosphoglycerate mutase-like protein 2 [Camelina sativa]
MIHQSSMTSNLSFYISSVSLSPLPSIRRLSSLRCCSSPLPSHDMEAKPSQGLYPLHRCKTIHLVRHAQGIHNVEGEKNHDAYLSEDLFDAHLTPLGWQQVDNLQKHVKASGISKRIELVVVSPLFRTLQTAVGTFGEEGDKNGVDAALLMVAGAGNSNRPAIASLNCPPFIAVESCREHLGVHPCDRRSNITKYRELFPSIEFSLIETDEDVLWKPNVREENKDIAARGVKFMNWLSTRKEKEIAVVTHSGFLYQTLNSFGNDCDPAVKNEISTQFANCELRSIVLVDKCMNSSNPPVTNYPGKMPAGEDLPSDIAAHK